MIKTKGPPPSGFRFLNVDLFGVMESIVEKHVMFYKTDFFDHDVLRLQETLGKTTLSERRFLWIPRICGTWLFREIDVMTRIPERKAFEYCYLQRDDALLFGVETRCGNVDPKRVMGNLFLLDYGEEYQKMREYTFSSDGKELDAAAYEAAQALERRRMLSLPDGDLAEWLADIEPAYKAA